MSYQQARNVRRELRTPVGRFRGGKLAPVCIHRILGSEGGMLRQEMTMELDPIAGRMITPITGELVSVFVPVQAMDALKDPEAAYAGMTEVVREKLLSGNPLFVLEPESELSKRMDVRPRSIGGQMMVGEYIRLAHNCAVNYLRRRKYEKASQLLAASTAITPALISQTVLERMNGVLDPDDRINGMVQLDLPDVQLPVEGIALESGSLGQALVNGSGYESDGSLVTYPKSRKTGASSPGGLVEMDDAGVPQVFAALNGVAAGGVSLTDFYNAEKMDNLTRTMRQIVEDNPEYGEEMVLRWAHGLSVDTGKTPFILGERRGYFGRSFQRATDTAGVEDAVMRSDHVLQLSITVPVPKTELGGCIVTFACLKPDEVLASQPHPLLTEPWGLENFVADELALDPVPVTLRELDSDCGAANENTVAMYTGLNQLKMAYVSYGFTRQVDPLTVENKTAVWQLEIPMSVTPDNILYPEELEHYPFADQLAEVCTYSLTSTLSCPTPLIVGPTPVEELAVIGDENLFEQEQI